jgi:predicted PurR-regulated permease PerM|tara:strand:+ start:289 stop:615 length:327 start_codon:yes stop_codon:yes gene_type:complete
MSWTVILGIFALLFIFSLVAHAATLWYVVNLVKQIRYYDEELTENTTVINNFTNHLRSVYELETFYGDETLRRLLEHAQDLTSVFDQYNLYSDTDIGEENTNDDIPSP